MSLVVVSPPPLCECVCLLLLLPAFLVVSPFLGPFVVPFDGKKDSKVFVMRPRGRPGKEKRKEGEEMVFVAAAAAECKKRSGAKRGGGRERRKKKEEDPAGAAAAGCHHLFQKEEKKGKRDEIDIHDKQSVRGEREERDKR